MALDSSSLERIIPDMLEHDGATGAPTLQLHLARYNFAAQHMQEGRVLDIACGVGYGTKLLSRRSDVIGSAIGVDISVEAIDHARTYYAQDNIAFIAQDALTFIDPGGFENIVSLETIEHVPDPRSFLQHLVKLLKPNGLLIGSVPVTPSVDANPHHRTDFTPKTFRRMGKELGLIEMDMFYQEQAYDPIAILTGQEKRSSGIRRNLLGYYIQNPGRFCARVYSTIVDGFTNRYLTVVWRKLPEATFQELYRAPA